MSFAPEAATRRPHDLSRARGAARAAAFGFLAALCFLPCAGASNGGAPIPLTPTETAWLRAHPVLRLAPAPDFPPVEFFDEEGRFRGIAADVATLLERRLGVRFEVRRFATWNAVVEATKRREVDVWTEATPTPERARYMRFTRPYLEFPAVIVVRKGTQGHLTLDRLAGMKVVGVANYVTRDYLADNYPEIDLLAVPELDTALKMVSFGLADALVENVAPVTYYIARDGLTNLTVAGESERRWGLATASRSDWPELAAILQKGLDSITPAERDEIVSRWVRLERTPRPWGRLLWGGLAVLVGTGAALGVVLLWNLSLRRSVRLRTEELRGELAERRKAEEAARRSEERLRRFFEASGEGLFFHDRGTIVDVNLASSRIFGYAPDELVGRQILEFVAPADRASVGARMAAQDEGPYEVRVCCRDGAEVPAEVRARTIEQEGGTLRVVAVQDVSGRKRIESALTTSEAELAARNASLEAIRTIANALYGSLDLDTVMNRAVDALMRHTRSPCVALFELSADGTHAELTAAKGFGDETLRAAARLPLDGSLTGIAVRSGEPAVSGEIATDSRLEPRTRQALATQGFRSAISVPLVAEGRVLGTINLLYREPRSPSPREREELALIGKTAGLALANARHVAEVRQAQSELEEKVAARTSELAQANERLKELDRLKSMFIASMSHELRTPLNSIIGFTGVILQGMSGDLTPRQRDQLQRVYGASKHLLALITDVIDISKIEAGRVDVYPTAFELGALVQEAVEAVRPQLEEKGLSLTVLLPEEGVRLHTDRKRLLQCVLNVVGNAVKYTETGSVRIESREFGDDVEVSVTDTGIGVPPEALGRLFQPFERVDTHLRVKTPGTGLGLYLTRKLATELLGGTVAVESEPGKGSTFRLKFARDIALRSAPAGGAP